jgi:hypothetical protein
MIKKKIVWQADAFALIAPIGAEGGARFPAALVFDPHQPFILASRVYPDGFCEPACLLAAVEEAMFTYGVTPTELHVRWGKEKGLESLAARAGFTLVLCDELRELSAVKKDLADHMRGAFAALTATAN